MSLRELAFSLEELAFPPRPKPSSLLLSFLVSDFGGAVNLPDSLLSLSRG